LADPLEPQDFDDEDGYSGQPGYQQSAGRSPNPAETGTDAIVRQAKARRAGHMAEATGGKTCLIVDDSRVVRKISKKIAMSLGYRVIEAENGEEGLARCKHDMPDLVLTDWEMPVMSGIEFVTALRAVRASKIPTVVFCTQKGEVTDIHRGIDAGADDYIVKPFGEDTLRAKLAKLGAR
jgi:two-component system chemotaxis response regulator CheY